MEDLFSSAEIPNTRIRTSCPESEMWNLSEQTLSMIFLLMLSIAVSKKEESQQLQVPLPNRNKNPGTPGVCLRLVSR